MNRLGRFVAIGFVIVPLASLAQEWRHTQWWTDTKTGVEWGYEESWDFKTCRIAGCGKRTGDLVIPSSVCGYQVTQIKDGAFRDCTSINSVTIPEGVTDIGNSAFNGCWMLTSVQIPTSVTNIGGYAFQDCYSLRTMVIPSGVTCIRNYTFYFCQSLTSVQIPTSVTNIGDYAFSDCYGLTSVTIPSGVTRIGDSAFFECHGLTSVTIPSSVKSVGNFAFGGCAGIASLSILSGVKSIGDGAFARCDGITTVTVPKSVTSIGACAFDCLKLTSITLPFVGSRRGNSGTADALFGHIFGTTEVGWPSLSAVTATKQSFSSSLAAYTTYYIPNSLKSVVITDETKIGYGAFENCSRLTSVTIPSSVTSIEDCAFENCSGLPSMVIPSGMMSIGYCAFKNCCGLSSMDIPSSVTSVGSFAFKDCTGLTSVIIPRSVEIGGGAFLGCEKLADANGFVIFADVLYDYFGNDAEVNIPPGMIAISDLAFSSHNKITSVAIPMGVKSIGTYAFEDCSGLKSLMIPSSVTSVGCGAFRSCWGLESVVLSEGLMGIGSRAFESCIELTSMDIPKSVTSIEEGAFANCSKLMKITLPFVGSQRGNAGTAESLFGYVFGTVQYAAANAVKQYYSADSYATYYIPTSLKTVEITDETKIGYGAFYNCSTLTSLNIQKGVMSIGVKAFYGCSGLTSMPIPLGVEDIGSYAFYGCTGLTSVTILKGVTSIGAYAFENCSALTSIMIPDGVISIGAEAFYGCAALESVTIPSSVTSIGDGVFSGCTRLVSVEIPEGVASIGRNMFSGCTGLASVIIPESVTSIGLSAFSRCSGLTSITMPSGMTSIGNSAFQGCSGLTSMAIPEGVTSIGVYAFSGCRGMSTIMIPSSVTSIGTYAFQNCSMLSLVVTDNGDVDRVKGMMREAEVSMSKIVFQEKGVLLPIIVPESETVFDVALKVSITNRVADAVVHYTVDGSKPTLDSPVFKKFTVTAKTTVKAIAEWCGIVSDVATAVYGKGRIVRPMISAEHVEDFHFPSNVVSISCATDGVEIHYTTSGEDPTATSPLYTTPFVVDDTVTIKAIAIGHVDYLDSDVAELSLVRTRLTVATPEISTWKGDESGGERMTELVGSFLWTKIECATENATIHYTTDGSEPTVASAVYERPFKVTDSAVITAVAFKDEWNDSLSASVRVTKRWKEGDSLNVPDMQFDGDGAAVWETDRTVSYDGVASMRSGDVGDGQYSALRTVVNGPGTVTFKWKASCEATDAPPYWWDYGSFLVDGEEVAWIDGETDWKDCEVAISGVGEHAISWRYKKDDFGKDGNDCVWVDMFSWQPSFSLVIEGGESATVTGDAGTGAVRISAPIGSVWEAIATEPWIKVITPTGSGSGTVTYQFTENLTGKVRTGKIIISGEEYTINQMYRVVMSVGVEGRGSVTGAGNYDYGADVTLTATPDADYSFSHWSGAASGSDNPVTIRIDEACKATAHFIPFVPTATATENELDGVTILWGALAWAEQYRVYRAEASQKPKSATATIAKGTLTWKDTTAAPGKTYYYWVEAVGSQEQTTSAATTGMRAVSPTGLAISCVGSLFSGQVANCGCTVSYNNGTARDVTPIWSVDGSGATVNESGVLTAGTVASDTIVTIQASYTENGITKTASAQVTVYPTFDVNDAVSGAGTLSTGGSGAWIGQKKESCGGATALRSPAVASGVSAWIGCSVAGAGTLTFKWRKSGTGSGKLALAVNGNESVVCGEASDSWTTVTKEFYDTDTKNIRWTYVGGSNVEAHGLVAEIVWTPGTAITVSFNANGGSGTMTGMTFLEGADVVLTANAFTRTGYAFAGWATSAGGEVAYLDGAAVWGMTAPVGGVVTLYAVWTPNVYTVRFAANDGEGTMADESMTYDTAKSLTACAFTRTGYTFAGWATSAGGAVKYANGATVKNLTATAGGTVTLYAKWTPNSYVVDFNPGQGGAGSMSDQPMTYDEEAALYANLFARTGYTFLGWTDDEAELEEVLYYDGVVVSNLTDEVDGEFDLYAVWAANEYTVKFNANGGSGTMVDQAFVYDAAQLLAANKFTRTGFTFAGWAKTAGGAVAYAGGAAAKNLTAEVDGVVTLYAKWTANPYSVAFDANGGEGFMDSVDCTYGTAQALPANAFTRTGYAFAGWAMSAGGAIAYADRASVSTLAASGVVTLYAKWTPVAYSVKFNANGGSGSMTNEAMTYDAAKALAACVFTKTGYAFAGWATSADGEVAYTNGQSVKNLTATQGAVVDLYAKWTANSYTVAFNANGGSGSMASESFTYDAAVKALTANAFTRTGYTFAGWATSASGAVKYADGAAVRNLGPSGTVTLYAKWTPISYLVKFNANGGTGTMANETMTFDSATSLTTCGFTWTGYHCIGWAVNPDGPVVHAQGANVKNLTAENGGSVSLYAVWAINHYTVKFNANGGAGTIADMSFTYGEGQKLHANAFTRVGWAFMGWATSAGGAVKYADEATVKNLTDADGGIVTLYAVWKNVGPAVVCEIAAEYRTKADVGVIPVEAVNVGETVKIAVKGLPSGVKFTAKDVKATAKSAAAPANSIYGTPTKSGVYAATVTVTPTDKKSKMAPIVKGLLFVVRNAGEHVVIADCDAAQGSVKGMGVYAPGKKVTLKATAAKGWVFAGWSDGGGAVVTQAASWTFEMPGKDVKVAARFVMAEADAKSTALSVMAGKTDIVQTKSIIVKQGMYVEWPVVASALSATTVKVSGLPSGLKFTTKDVMKKGSKTEVEVPVNTIYGKPSAASKTDKNGNVTPSKVKITVTTAGKAKQEYVLNVTVRGISAEGIFNGGGESGIVTLTVAKTGKISGKYLADGKTWTLSAAGFDTWDDNDRMTATLTAKSGKEVETLKLVYEDGYVCASLTSGKDSASPLWEAWRNGWKEEPLKTLATKLKGQKAQVGEVLLTVGASGTVTAKGAFGAYSASCSTVLIPTEKAGLYKVCLYFPPKAGKFDGFVDMVEVNLGERQ